MFTELIGAEKYLDAIRSAPNEPSHRYAFADWLKSIGDPRESWLRNDELWPYMAPNCRNPVPKLIRESSIWQADVSDRARRLLGFLGAPAIDSIRKSYLAIDGEDWTVQNLLTNTPPSRLQPVPELVEALNDTNWKKAFLAVIDLGFHGPKASEAIPSLLNYHHPVTSDSDCGDVILQATFRTLGKIGAIEAIPKLFQWLDFNENDAEAAADGLRELAKKYPDELLKKAQPNTEGGRREYPFQILVEVHPEGLGVMQHFLLDRPEVYQGASSAAMVVAERADRAASLVPALIKALQNTKIERYDSPRQAIALALAKIGDPAKEAIPVLRTVLSEYPDSPLEQRDSGSWDRMSLGIALVKLGDLEFGLPQVRAALRSENPVIRHEIVRQVGELCPVPELLPDVLHLMQDEMDYIRSTTAYALGHFRLEDANLDTVLPIFLKAMRDPDGNTRSGTTGRLGALRRNQHLTENDPRDRQILETLLKATQDQEYQVCTSALGALTYAPLPGWVAAPLLSLLTSIDEYGMNDMSVRALQQVRNFPDEQIPVALSFLARGDWLAETVARYLASQGDNTRKVLEAAQNHSNENVRKTARLALSQS